jgi:O-antigen/teichoic acid export membrane protein
VSLSAKSFAVFKRDVFLFATNLFTGVVVARTLGPSALGLWVILQMILGYAESFGRAKLDVAAVYVLGKKKHQIGEVVATLNAVAIASSLVIVALVLFRFDWLYHVLFAKSDIDVRVPMLVILAQIPLQFLSLNYSYLHVYREDVGSYNGMVIVKALFFSVVGLTMLVVLRLGLLAVVVASVLSVFCGLLFGVVRLGRTERTGPLVNLPLIKDLASYGSVFYLTGIIGQFNAYVTRLVVVFYLAPAQVAYFAMAQNEGQLLNKVPDALNTLLYPRIAKMERDEDSAALAARAFRVVLVILTAAGAVAFVAIEPVVHVLYGRAFGAMVTPFRIILPGLILSGATTVIDQYFSGVGRADLIAKIAVVPLVVQLATAVVLIPRWGIVGAGVAFLVALLCVATLQLTVLLRISACTIRRDLLIRQEDVRLVGMFIRSQIGALQGRLSFRRA